jgi:hypothetical protein
MKDIRKLTYRDFYNISIDELYVYCVTIMKSLNYVFYRRIKDTTTRRAEIWKLFDSDEFKVMVWIEIQDPAVELSWQESADILRVMNDENVTKLFLFTNGNLDEDAKDILGDENHFIYTPRNIIEKLLSLEEIEEKPVEVASKKKLKRKMPARPYGHALLIEYFKGKEKNVEKTKISLEELKVIVSYIVDNYKEVETLIKSIEDIDNIKKEEKEVLDKNRKKFLPSLYKLTLIKVEPEFNYILEELSNLIKNIIYYISAIIDYEVLENIELYKKEIAGSLAILNNLDDNIYKYLQTHVSLMSNAFERLIKYSFILMVIIIIFAIFVF